MTGSTRVFQNTSTGRSTIQRQRIRAVSSEVSRRRTRALCWYQYYGWPKFLRPASPVSPLQAQHHRASPVHLTSSRDLEPRRLHSAVRLSGEKFGPRPFGRCSRQRQPVDAETGATTRGDVTRPATSRHVNYCTHEIFNRSSRAPAQRRALLPGYKMRAARAAITPGAAGGTERDDQSRAQASTALPLRDSPGTLRREGSGAPIIEPTGRRRCGRFQWTFPARNADLRTSRFPSAGATGPRARPTSSAAPTHDTLVRRRAYCPGTTTDHLLAYLKKAARAHRIRGARLNADECAMFDPHPRDLVPPWAAERCTPPKSASSSCRTFLGN